MARRCGDSSRVVARSAGRGRAAVATARARRGHRAPRGTHRRTTCGTTAIAALRRYARELDGLSGPIEIPRREWERARRDAAAVGPTALTRAAPSHPPRRAGASAARVPRHGRAGRRRRAARDPARPCGLLRARRPLSAALVAADDRHSGARRGRARDRRGVPAAGSGGAGRGDRGRRRSAASGRRRARRRRARLRHRSGAARGQDRRPRQPLGGGGEGAGQPRLRHRLLRRPDRDRHRRRARPGRLDCRRSDRAGRARPRRARGADHAEPAGWRSRWRATSNGSRRADGPARASLARARRHHRHRVAGGGDATRQRRGAGAPGRRDRGAGRAGSRRGLGVRRTLDGAGGRRLRHRLESRAADRRRGALPRRAARRGLRAPGHGAAPDPRRTRAPGADGDHAGPGRGAGRARAIDRHEDR